MEWDGIGWDGVGWIIEYPIGIDWEWIEGVGN